MTTGMPDEGTRLPALSLVIPVRNGAHYLDACLEAVGRSEYAPCEVIVINDGSTDDTAAVARRHGARVVSWERSRGPAYARNRGAEIARGDVVFFIDADVRVRPDTLRIGAGCFARDPGLTAVIGSYDDQPGHPSFLSQYKNLFHHWVHQTSREDASTFWTGCGAIRRDVFLTMGGFNEGYPKPSIEDIELGFRLRAAGHRIRLEKRMLARHMKQWRLLDLVRTDVLLRGVPWIALMLRDRYTVGDLNLSAASRHSTMATYLGAGMLLALPFVRGDFIPWLLAAALACLAAVVWMHRPFYAFFVEKRGPAFALMVFPMHLLFFLYSGTCIPLGICAHWRDRRHARRTQSGPAVRRLVPLADAAPVVAERLSDSVRS